MVLSQIANLTALTNYNLDRISLGVLVSPKTNIYVISPNRSNNIATPIREEYMERKTWRFTSIAIPA